MPSVVELEGLIQDGMLTCSVWSDLSCSNKYFLHEWLTGSMAPCFKAGVITWRWVASYLVICLWDGIGFWALRGLNCLRGHTHNLMNEMGMWGAEPAITISCHNCGHGTDLRGCPQSPFQIEGTVLPSAYPPTCFLLPYCSQSVRESLISIDPQNYYLVNQWWLLNTRSALW
jgi:hypothetical protein